MRPQIEIQRLHDMLMDVLGRPTLVKAVIPEGYQRPLMMVADCVCWILHHDVDNHPDAHASDFARLLQALRGGLEEVGYTQDAPPESEYIIEE